MYVYSTTSIYKQLLLIVIKNILMIYMLLFEYMYSLRKFHICFNLSYMFTCSLFTGVLYFVSSTVNPVLYNAMSKKYRRAFMKTIVPCLLSKSREPTSASNYNSHVTGATGFSKSSSPYFYNKLAPRHTTRISNNAGQNETVDSPL